MSARKFGPEEPLDKWARNIHELLDEMHNRAFFEYRASRVWEPRVNVYTSRHAFHICVELAGLSPEALTVECRDATHVRVIGQRPRTVIPDLEGPFSVEVMEIDEGPFCRDIELPEPVDADNADSLYDRGYLWVTLPKSHRA